jgi:hypothetical protein
MPRNHRGKQLFQVINSALSGLFDQSQPFGRLALVHVFQAAGSGLVAVSLAGSLFFSISPDAAKSKVLLYLLLTIAPFALVGPALSPLLDRGRQARRTSVAIANGGSALICIGMSRTIHDLLLFPEAFVVLVLAKLYVVARAAIVPEMVGSEDDLASTNAKLAVLASLSGFAILPFGLGLLKIGAPWVLYLAVVVFGAGTYSALRLPRPQRVTNTNDVSGYVGKQSDEHRPATYNEVTRERRRMGLPVYAGGVVAGVNAMSVARGCVGFVAFFLAFSLRRAHATTWWFGLLLVASGAGSLLGSMLVPRLRKYLTERRIIIFALALIAFGALGAGLIDGRWAQVMLTFVVGVGPTSAKAALDSIVQHNVPPALLGRTFGRIETRLQLMWVIASLIGVLIPFPLRIGDGVVAVTCVLSLFAYVTSGSSQRRLRPASAGERRRS